MTTSIDLSQQHGIGLETDATNAEYDVATIYAAAAPDYATLCKIEFTDQAGREVVLRVKHDRGGWFVVTAQGAGDALITYSY